MRPWPETCPDQGLQWRRWWGWDLNPRPSGYERPSPRLVWSCVSSSASVQVAGQFVGQLVCFSGWQSAPIVEWCAEKCADATGVRMPSSCSTARWIQLDTIGRLLERDRGPRPSVSGVTRTGANSVSFDRRRRAVPCDSLARWCFRSSNGDLQDRPGRCVVVRLTRC